MSTRGRVRSPENGDSITFKIFYNLSPSRIRVEKIPFAAHNSEASC